MKFLLSDDWTEEIHWKELTHGFLADRYHHTMKKKPTGILNALEQGKLYICNRYNLSTYAYQLPSEEYFEWYYTCSNGLPIPDLTIFLRFDLESCLKKAQEIYPRNKDEFSILNRKARQNPKELEAGIASAEKKYLRAIEFLRKQIPPHNIEIIDVDDVRGAWYILRPIIENILVRD